jgi:hypothetical protein
MAELSREMWPSNWPENVERIRASCAAASQLGVGELGEGAGEGRFVGHLAGMRPAAEPAKGGVVSEDFEQLPGVDEAVDTLGKKGAGMDWRSLLGRPFQRPEGRNLAIGTMAQTAIKREPRSEIGSRTGSKRGRSSCRRMWVNWVSLCKRLPVITLGRSVQSSQINGWFSDVP